MSELPVYKKKDFVSDQEVRWCPGCGDYAILSSVQMAMTKIGVKRENICVVSGIGCSSRFPYYMNTYGMHTIHGRAAAIASGLKSHNPDLSVWVVSGDGDSLAIGGNHFIHAVRRNIDINYLMFNNEIYGLTKGQYSPTTKEGQVTKSTPYGVIDHPFQPASLALGAEATFYARTIDTDPKHIQEMMIAASNHKGISVVEVMQNCVIFNHEIHAPYTARATRDDNSLRLEHGKPMIFGANMDKGVRLNGLSPEIVTIGENGITEADILIHDAHAKDDTLAHFLSRFQFPDQPVPIGIFRDVEKKTYDDAIVEQVRAVTEKKGKQTMEQLVHSGDTWEVK